MRVAVRPLSGLSFDLFLCLQAVLGSQQDRQEQERSDDHDADRNRPADREGDHSADDTVGVLRPSVEAGQIGFQAGGVTGAERGGG
jgi:hypothetical protein